ALPGDAALRGAGGHPRRPVPAGARGPLTVPGGTVSCRPIHASVTLSAFVAGRPRGSGRAARQCLCKPVLSEYRMAIDGVNPPLQDGAPAARGEPVDTGRRRFLTATTAVVGAVGAGFVAVPFIKSWNPSERAQLAGAPVSADISALGE